MTSIIILPGIGGSGEAHWQTLWEKEEPRMQRFRPANWNEPQLPDWISALERSVATAPVPPILVAHSLACLLVAHWQKASTLQIAGAFLVAVPDPQGAAFPKEAKSFANPPTNAFRFPSLIVASADDPYGTLDYARARARQWQSRLVEIGACGHINGESGLGDWPAGLDLLRSFAAECAEMAGRRA
ncbi:RBBP9/YdeN family alpha/beta hydrolase [Sinorhizobium mexicanum]|uniref:Serine hydrolase family protein n=1 Tax=Sinorhizobium mexicanum TaxID=375549 RepID=A0A859QIY6_9HYPH|nr:alpha/beta hydrolase [Sinorhizobium mexicanum]MBP1882361.1 putative alpha/beta hydrolase family esterase [Sinorhizobium mexicanum]QLL62070.1 serine hydrolase family protein [Sinorhizobium mexicanum]